MKTSVLILLWPMLALFLQAQTTCRPCCDAPDQPDLLPILAPQLADQCPNCTLIAVWQCPITDSDIAAQQTILRYTLRDPEGITSTHLTPMTLTPNGWHLQLYPTGDPAPPCDPSAL